MPQIEANVDHEKVYQAFCKVVGNEGANIEADILLAIACNFVGKLIATQDQRKYTSDAIMQLVIKNIQAGNDQAIEDLANTQGPMQ